ncbi:hypothetical protein ACUN0C_19860 [Faunimonas sp. B44]|uniref:hypothetical protein n=1 Tax=Faunimonas sp. B44 TaxID=3461493 RepID=UPI004044E6ED
MIGAAQVRFDHPGVGSAGSAGADGADVWEAEVAAAYGRCHALDSWADLTRRAAFDKRAKGLMRHWLAAAGPAQEAGGASPREPAARTGPAPAPAGSAARAIGGGAPAPEPARPSGRAFA